MDGYMVTNFVNLPILGFNFLDGYASGQPKYPMGVPCEDCGKFCKQQCCIQTEDFKINYPDSWIILNPDEWARRAAQTLLESKVR